MERRTPDILHVDLDAFYASVEELKNPALAGVPFVVGGGVVLSASYAARAFGVRSAMGIRTARRLCPGLVVVRGEFAEYGPLSRRVIDICRRFTPTVEQISIDEAFCDVGGSVRLFGPSPDIAARIRREVRAETGLTVSVGAARTKFLAKVASKLAKPDGLVVVDPQRELEFLHPLPVEAIWGVGEKTAARLRSYGIDTVGELAALESDSVAGWLGPGAGRHLHALAWNRDPRRVRTRTGRGSVGSQRAFGGDVRDPGFHDRVLLSLGERVGGRLRAKRLAGRTVTLRVRFADFSRATRSTTLAAATSSSAALHDIGLWLLDRVKTDRPGTGFSLLGISVSRLEEAPAVQLELDVGGDAAALERAGSPAALARLRLEHSLDGIRDRYGRGAITPAALLGDPRHTDDPLPILS